MNDQFPFGYERIAATSWAYVSSLAMLCVFFKFNRFWSVRNFDLLLIILLAPGILLIESGRQWSARDADRQAEVVNVEAANQEAGEKAGDGQPGNTRPDDATGETPGESRDTEPSPAGPQPADSSETEPGRSQDGAPATDGKLLDDSNAADAESPATLSTPGNPLNDGQRLQRSGYYWLFAVAALFLIRMLFDPLLVRRPLLEPNLSIGGLVFMACSLMIFLFANIITAKPNTSDLRIAQDSVRMLQRENAGEEGTQQLRQSGPGYRLLYLFPIIPSFSDSQQIMETDSDPELNMDRYVIASRSLAIVSQNLIVLGLVLFGFMHFKSFRTGVGMATIYLMLPYTAMYTGHVMHALPASLLIWALVLFRRPVVAGIFIGLATGVSYYALFLLPLWMSFYWEKGRTRFLIGFLCSLSICVFGLIFTSSDVGDFFTQLQAMFGFWLPLRDGLDGIWALGWNQWYRVPLLVAFMALSISFAFWPGQKNLGTLISYSCVVMAAVQFWHGFGGGQLMAWYVPLALLAFFRPNTSGRIAKVELSVAEEKRRLRSSNELSEELLSVE